MTENSCSPYRKNGHITMPKAANALKQTQASINKIESKMFAKANKWFNVYMKDCYNQINKKSNKGDNSLSYEPGFFVSVFNLFTDSYNKYTRAQIIDALTKEGFTAYAGDYYHSGIKISWREIKS